VRRAARPSATRAASELQPQPFGRRARRLAIASTAPWFCVRRSARDAACCRRTGSRRSCPARARTPPPLHGRRWRVAGARFPRQSRGRCRGSGVSYRWYRAADTPVRLVHPPLGRCTTGSAAGSSYAPQKAKRAPGISPRRPSRAVRARWRIHRIGEPRLRLTPGGAATRPEPRPARQREHEASG